MSSISLYTVDSLTRLYGPHWFQLFNLLGKRKVNMQINNQYPIKHL